MSYHIRVRAGAIIIDNGRILLTEYNIPARGVVYDLPAGGVEPNEYIIDTIKREAKEEASVDYEYAPHLNDEKFGSTHTLVMMSSRRHRGPQFCLFIKQSTRGYRSVAFNWS